MRFEIKTDKSISDLVRTIGYQSTYLQNDEEFSVVRKLGTGDYPRFHLYVKEEKDNFLLSLHLDHKKPSYQGTSRHGGEYEGDLVQEESERIKSLV